MCLKVTKCLLGISLSHSSRFISDTLPNTFTRASALCLFWEVLEVWFGSHRSTRLDLLLTCFLCYTFGLLTRLLLLLFHCHLHNFLAQDVPQQPKLQSNLLKTRPRNSKPLKLIKLTNNKINYCAKFLSKLRNDDETDSKIFKLKAVTPKSQSQKLTPIIINYSLN